MGEAPDLMTERKKRGRRERKEGREGGGRRKEGEGKELRPLGFAIHHLKEKGST